MNYETIDEIYSANGRIRAELAAVVSAIPDELAAASVDGEPWTLAEIVEHLALVEASLTRVCAKLLSKAEAEGRKANGRATISKAFLESAGSPSTARLEAPDIVKPSGGKLIAESLENLAQSRSRVEEIRPMFEKFDGVEAKFPHPAFGNMSAHEWLALIGAHEARHLKQIERILAKLK